VIVAVAHLEHGESPESPASTSRSVGEVPHCGAHEERQTIRVGGAVDFPVELVSEILDQASVTAGNCGLVAVDVRGEAFKLLRSPPYGCPSGEFAAELRLCPEDIARVLLAEGNDDESATRFEANKSLVL
jgi:hypothetical protein